MTEISAATKKVIALVAVATAFSAFTGCSSDDKSSAVTPIADASASDDAVSTDAASDDAASTDAGDAAVDARRRGAGNECATSTNCCTTYGTPPTRICDDAGSYCFGGRCGCTGSEDCQASGHRTTCDTVTGGCVECLDDATCASRSADRPLCVKGECVDCATAADCAKSPKGPFCELNFCVECFAATDCATSPNGKLCSANYCGCDRDADCPTGRVCDGGTCVAACKSNADCTEAGRRSCDTTTGWCVACTTNAECEAVNPGSVCLLTTHECGCNGPSDCEGNVWGSVCIDNVCGCRTNLDCPYGRSCEGKDCR